MATLYITEQSSTLRKEQNRLVIERDGIRLAEIHDFKVERVVVFGNPQLTTQAMAYLLDRGIDTSFVSLRGRLKGRLASLESKNVFLRLRQYERASNRQFALDVARAIVAGKVNNCAEVLSRHQRNHPECSFDADISQLNALAEKVARTSSIESLRGVEGQAAIVYFKAFSRMLRRGMNFTKRTRRPPTDPVNAMISFAYTLLYNEAISATATAGFDPYVGFYHQTHYGRCSLALDLMEDMRPVAADRLALGLANREMLRAEDFRRESDGAVLLGDEGRKRFLREYERMMSAEFSSRKSGERTSLRRALYEQSVALQRAIMQGAKYAPFQGWH